MTYIAVVVHLPVPQLQEPTGQDKILNTLLQGNLIQNACMRQFSDFYKNVH